MKTKLKKIYRISLIIGVLVMIFFYFSNKKNLYFAFSHLDHYSFAMDYDICNKELLEKGKMLSFNFCVQGNNWRHNLDIYVETLQYRKNIYIEKIVFMYKDEEETVFIKKRFNLNVDTINFECNEANHKMYRTLINTYKNKINFFRINMFKKRKTEGKSFPIKMIAYYSFDDGEIENSKYLYEAYCYERSRHYPDWMYWLFPGMY